MTSKQMTPARCAMTASLAVVFVLWSSPPSPAQAQTLSLDRCLALWRTIHQVDMKAIAVLAAKDPRQLTSKPSDLEKKAVKTYLDTIEKLKFRCRNFMPPPPGAESP